ncbi:MAG: SDR family NAD(P)-dependent oxidoreductase [Methanobacterium sp.]
MSELRFDGQVVIITGAGRGMGRSHAIFLAGRGASVVVNDIGCDIFGNKVDTSPAEDVVNEIKRAGGTALLNTDSVATKEGCQALVDKTIRQFGRVDALVHNAGINYKTPFPEITQHDLDANFNVHYFAAVYLTQGAWPYFVKQGGGSVVYMCSDGTFGNPTFADYSSAKMAGVGLMRTLYLEGAEYGIRVNSLSVGAATRMWEDTMSPAHLAWGRKYYPPIAVSQVVSWLIHPDNPTSGEWYGVDGYTVFRVALAVNEGYTKLNYTLEDIRDNWGKVNALENFTYPRSTGELFGNCVGKLIAAGAEPMPTNADFGTGIRKTGEE